MLPCSVQLSITLLLPLRLLLLLLLLQSLVCKTMKPLRLLCFVIKPLTAALYVRILRILRHDLTRRATKRNDEQRGETQRGNLLSIN